MSNELEKFKAVLKNGEEICSEKGFAVFVREHELDVRFIDMHPQEMMSILIDLLYEVMTLVKQHSTEAEAQAEAEYNEDHPFLQ